MTQAEEERRPGDEERGIRSFIAVAVPESIRRAIMDAGQQICAGIKGLSCTRKLENLHITVAFLGDVAPALLDRLAAELQAAVRDLPAFRLRLQGAGAFPSPGRARVLWAGTHDDTGGLAAIAVRVRDVVELCGLPVEDRPFRGHITFARARRAPVNVRQTLEAFADLTFGETEITELHLYESRLGREGSTYTLRSRALLATAQPT